MIAGWFDNISLQKKLLVSFLIPITLIVIVSFSVYENTQSIVKDNHWVVHTHKAIARAQELLNLIVDMETGQRGYLITGDPVFLEPYHLALDVWRQKMQSLSTQVSDNPPQVERLKRIDDIHKTWLKESGEKEIMQRNLVNDEARSLIVDLDGEITRLDAADTALTAEIARIDLETAAIEATYNNIYIDDSTTNRIIVNADHGKIIRMTSDIPSQVTLGASLRTDLFFGVEQVGLGTVTFVGIDGAAVFDPDSGNDKTAAQYSYVMVKTAEPNVFTPARSTKK